MKIEFFRHNIEREDIHEAVNVLKSVFLTTGPVNAEFEKKFSGYTGLNEIVSLNSCTGALHLSMLALGIGKADEVITTPMTFASTATSILQAGAKPIFVDVEKETALIDAGKIEAAVTPRTKAIIPVHLYGCMSDMKAIRAIADKHNLAVIEDCAHCIEGERDGVRPGQLGDAACYSFYATKNLSCGEGGALGTNNVELAENVRLLRNHGISSDAVSRYVKKYRHWDVILPGWKYNLDDIHAALLVKQINRLEGYLKRREEIWGMYDEHLADVQGIKLPQVKGRSARHLYTIWASPEKRDDILRMLQERGIGVAVNYRAVHTLKYFREEFGLTGGDFPVADVIGKSTISLPLYPRLEDYEVDYICKFVRKITLENCSV